MKSSAARFVWLLILVGICVHARAQDTDDAGARSKVLALEHAWNQAEAFNDLKAMDSIFDNRLVYIDSDGTLMTKAEFLSHVKTSHLQQVITQSMTVQLFGDMAIVDRDLSGEGVQRRKEHPASRAFCGCLGA